MSRTEKTQPFQVRLWDGTLQRVAVHDHTNGVCDLPCNVAESMAQYGPSGRDRHACYWDLHFTGIYVCGCGICRNSAGLRDLRRADRHREKRRLREVLKLVRADREATD